MFNKRAAILLLGVIAYGAFAAEAQKPLRGYNINWSFLPQLNDEFIQAATLLNPDIIRYPGGTISKTWHWEDGITSKHRNRVAHPLADLLTLKTATNTDVIFVLNTITSSLENQLLLLQTAQNMGIPIKYIEMGNEHYLGKQHNVDDTDKHQDNVAAFPTGKEYAELVNIWAAAIKAKYPDVKIGITLLGRENKRNQRLHDWNRLIMENIDGRHIDAHVYHIYVRVSAGVELDDEYITATIKHRANVFESVRVASDKELWITEYGVHAQTEMDSVNLTARLADYVESIAAISMPHVLYGKSRRTYFSMLSQPNADQLTPLGKHFADRMK